MNDVQKRLQEFISYLGISVMEFEQQAKLSNGFATSTNKKMRKGSKMLIEKAYPELNLDWLINGVGDMLNRQGNTINSSGANAVNAINGNAILYNAENKHNKPIPENSLLNEVANGEVEIKDYNDDSMIEIPNGVNIFAKKLNDINQIIWGKIYLIKTDQIDIVRRIQDGGETIIAYSSNDKTYKDGMTIYAPVQIKKEAIKEIYLITGYIKRI